MILTSLVLNKIYPSSLVLNNENVYKMEGDVLDFNIKDSEFVSSTVCDQRERLNSQ